MSGWRKLIQPERIVQVKEMYLRNGEKNDKIDKSVFLVDVLSKSEGEGCTIVSSDRVIYD